MPKNRIKKENVFISKFYARNGSLTLLNTINIGLVEEKRGIHNYIY